MSKTWGLYSMSFNGNFVHFLGLTIKVDWNNCDTQEICPMQGKRAIEVFLNPTPVSH